MQITSRDYRNLGIQERNQSTYQAGFTLAALAEQDHMMAGKNRILDLGKDGFLIPEEVPGETGSDFHPRDQIRSQFLSNRTGSIPRGSQFPERGRMGG